MPITHTSRDGYMVEVVRRSRKARYAISSYGSATLCVDETDDTFQSDFHDPMTLYAGEVRSGTGVQIVEDLLFGGDHHDDTAMPRHSIYTFANATDLERWLGLSFLAEYYPETFDEEGDAIREKLAVAAHQIILEVLGEQAKADVLKKG